MRRGVLVIGTLAVLWVAVVVVVNRMVRLPDVPLATDVRPAAQNWSADLSRQYHHAAQGSELLPYAWLLALEQPRVTWSLVGEVPRFMEDAYISRFGFLPDTADPVYNPDGLPVGIARDERWTNPVTGEKQVMAGLTCAACHTGQLESVGKDGVVRALRVDGGAAMVDLQRFETAFGVAAALTRYLPGRFDRFAHRVLKDRYTDAEAAQLKTAFSAVVKAGIHEILLDRRYKVYPHQPGYGRVDALNRIGNQVFGLEVNAENLAPADAPVAFPHLWGASWWDYVQYNGSVPQPLVRNVGEALGVRTPYVGKGDKAGLYRSAAHVDTLWALEEWLSGPSPYQGLKAPTWPADLFGAIDDGRAAQGKALYQQHCVRCHLPPPGELLEDRDSAEPRFWTAKNFRGDRLLQLKLVPLAEIGTDPKQAQEFSTRKADTGDLGLGTINAGAALDHVSTEVTRRYFVDNHIDDAQQIAWNNGHKLGAEGPRVELAYKARPLDGVWATPPFLHNGSVPTLFDLLSPANQRPARFTLSRRQFDARKVGYATDAVSAVDAFDVTVEGNSNAGHEFADAPGKAGVIGPLLSEDQRLALVEYLKTF